jgi:hypothetical protein
MLGFHKMAVSGVIVCVARDMQAASIVLDTEHLRVSV